MNADDLTGKKFGKLTAIEMAEPEYRKNGQKVVRWLCRCECGKERIVRASRLKRGEVMFCGAFDPPEKEAAKYRKCRYCEYSTWDDALYDWQCSKGKDTSVVKNRCSEYWCAPIDKLLGTTNQMSTCFICGKPVYAHGRNVPLYCKDHRAKAKEDDALFENAPKELLFSLIAGIFLRAREDYLTNADGQRSDAEVFLRGVWAQTLSLGGFDADRLLQMLNEEPQ